MKNLFTAIFALLLPVLASAQLSISGKITNQSGEALPGATIFIVNVSANTTADATGNYNFSNLKNGNYIIKASYIGYRQISKNITLTASQTLNFTLTNGILLTDAVTIKAIRAGKNSPTTFTNLHKKDLKKNNFGQDLPYLLDQTPSVVITSDAGAGVGYTAIRIRGSDATRTNLTLNGIPLNDAEDQGAYFVDLPDLVSSVDNLQIQRGVGTSTNGAGAFGASINIQTTTRRDTGYAELNNSAGSYGTLKNTVSFGSGLVGGKFTFDGRLSRIKSDGYIDRASSDLKSYFISGAYYGKNTLVRVNVFSGQEKTYQAWNGVPQDTVPVHPTYNGLGLEPNGTYYNDQTDNYTQNYAQVLVSQKISSNLTFNGALHYTKGFGYYQEYKPAETISDYGIMPVIIGDSVIEKTDLVRRLWLSNDFYGLTYAFNYVPKPDMNFTLAGAYNQYKGAHYNNIEWTQQSTNIPPDYEYSRDDAKKNDFNIFAKGDVKLNNITLFADVQYRHLDYSFFGFDRDLNNVQQSVTMNYFNPKGGITYHIDDYSNAYVSLAVANHEPSRDDFTASTPDNRPKSENLKDWEAGYRISKPGFNLSINGFYMAYDNQLVVTGQINDVGGYIHSNVKDSYRAGIELDGKVHITPRFYWAATAALSSNKVKNFTEFLDAYDADGNSIPQVENKYGTTDLPFSPAFVGSSELNFSPLKGADIALLSKYVGKQYLDNTSSENRKLDAFFVNNVRLSYNFKVNTIKNIGIALQVNNIFSEKYSSNGYTYGDIEDNQRVDYNSYFPQAPRNFMASLNLAF